MVIHQRTRAGGVAQLDEVGELGVDFENVARELWRGGDVAARPGHVLERDKLHHEHAIVRSLRDREVKVARQPGEGIKVADGLFGLTQQGTQLGDVGGGRILGGELGAERLDRALRIHDLGGGNAGEVELHGERFREQARIALGDARAAAFAHADLDDAERLEGAQGIARHDAACVETGGEVFFGAEEVAGLELLGEEGVADPGNDLRRQR